MFYGQMEHQQQQQTVRVCLALAKVLSFPKSTFATAVTVAVGVGVIFAAH